MTSFFLKMFLCFRVRVEVRVSENQYKYVFGQTSIRASVLDPYQPSDTATITLLNRNKSKSAEQVSGKRAEWKRMFRSVAQKLLLNSSRNWPCYELYHAIVGDESKYSTKLDLFVYISIGLRWKWWRVALLMSVHH